MGQRALILGSAACQAADVAAALQLFAPDLVVAVNQAACDWPGELEAWASYHCELFPKWVAEREAAGRPAAKALYTGERRFAVPGLKIKRVPNWGGSSGLLACVVAIDLGVEKGVLCGIPMDAHQGHYYSPGKRWSDGGNYRRGWMTKLDQLGRFRSMSGLTREWLGAPTKGWLDGTAEDSCDRRDGDGGRGGGADRRGGEPDARGGARPGG